MKAVIRAEADVGDERVEGVLRQPAAALVEIGAGDDLVAIVAEDAAAGTEVCRVVVDNQVLASDASPP